LPFTNSSTASFSEKATTFIGKKELTLCQAANKQGIDLFVSLHGCNMCRIGSASTACHDNGSDNRCHLAHDSHADQIGHVDSCAKALQLHRADKRENRADQAVDDCNNGKRSGTCFTYQLPDIADTSASTPGQACRIPQDDLAHEHGNVDGVGP
jgi:hypothetical protein